MKMRVNRKLLPIKAHFFFFMAAMGPILPQLQVYGKELGISSVVMGSITGVLPFLFLLAKPLFGMLVDVYRDYRKAIFMMLIVILTSSYTLMNFIPSRRKEFDFNSTEAISFDRCKETDLFNENLCTNETTRVICTSNCFNGSQTYLLSNVTHSIRLCSLEYVSSNATHIENATFEEFSSLNNSSCNLQCLEDVEYDNGCLYESYTFWSFVILMSIGTIGFNVVNSISDAICFDVIGEQYDYGKQRVWGTIGFGLTALVGGYIVDLVSGTAITYTPAIIVMIVGSVLDLITCIKLKLPIIEAPKNICKDIKEILNEKKVVTFLSFAVCAGILDGFLIYFLFWYLEDLAVATNTGNIKLIEGLIVACETLGGEVLFFSIAGKILERFGHVHCFSMCFVNYALRLGLISLAPSPWWILPIEFAFQGPTYALTYTTIVAYANELAPPGASATMQGIAAGMDDGIGYAVGSLLGGIMLKYVGGEHTFQFFSAIGVLCAIVHLILHKTILSDADDSPDKESVEYKSPEEAVIATTVENGEH